MESWELEFEWLRIRHMVKDMMALDKLPDFQAMLFLIGIQELGRWQERFTKEEKQDLMHIATCRLLEDEGYYTFVGRDQDGWPHYEKQLSFTIKGVKDQETYLMQCMIKYFDTLESESKNHQLSHDA